MLIFAIDDEPKMLHALHVAIEQARPDAEIRDFGKVSEVQKALAEEGMRPEVVFSDIEMPGMDGLELAVHIKNDSPKSKIIFVTGFPKYAADAYRLHVNGYILKPVVAQRVREELDALGLAVHAPELAGHATEPEEKLRIQCFGYFEVFWQGKPLIFKRTQTKELLAYLIDREGEACTSDEIITALWESDRKESVAKGHLRVLINDLRTTLRDIGMEKLLIRERRQVAICRDLVDCDYYQMLSGDVSAVNAYAGEYMKQYSWAEMTVGRLYFRRRS